jgi:hypothetical protein
MPAPGIFGLEEVKGLADTWPDHDVGARRDRGTGVQQGQEQDQKRHLSRCRHPDLFHRHPPLANTLH